MTNHVDPRGSMTRRLPTGATPKGPATRVLGVDTSMRSTGYGVVDGVGNSYSGVCWGQIKNPAKRLHSECLAHLNRELQSVITQTKPAAVALEGVFFSKNVRTAVILGQARGVVLATCALEGLPVYEYSPRSVKQAVVGNGNAHKEQVMMMVGRLLGITEALSDDAADGIALAICHLHQFRHPNVSKTPDRV